MAGQEFKVRKTTELRTMLEKSHAKKRTFLVHTYRLMTTNGKGVRASNHVLDTHTGQ